MPIYSYKAKGAVTGLFPCCGTRALSPRLLRVRGVGYPKGSEGVALVVVLFAVTLISIMVLVYFNLALLNRNISYSSAGEARANVLALSALDFVKGDFIAEIQSSSAQLPDPTGSSVPIYQPLTNSTMLPYRMTSSVSLTAGSYPPNLVKWSSGTVPLWPATPAYNSIQGPNRATIDPSSGSSIPTTQPSLNGHFIPNSPTSLWTKPEFGTSATFPTSIVPQWVYMTRQGPLRNSTPVTSVSVLANSSTTNSNYVIGRYAYTVYDEGGLVDVTAAGFSPTTFSSDATDVGRKGNQGFADLTQLGLSPANVDQLVYWRNTTNGPSVAGYVGYLGTNYPSATNAPSVGFLQAAPGDQAFVSRQDLIQYWTAELGANPNLLQYVTTFSREKNAPSWGPEYDAHDANSSTYWNGTNTDAPYDSVSLNDSSGGISYAYHSNKDNPNPVTPPAITQAYNRFFPNVRALPAALFTRLNGEQAIAGEPLVKNRFDLTKLAWITYNGVLPTGVAPQDVYNYFGLIRNYDVNGVFQSWTYNHTTPTVPPGGNGAQATDTSMIMTLDQVAVAGREPDFFELLQATILRGSLGLCSGDPAQANNAADGGPVNENDAGGEFWRAANASPPGPLIPVDDSGVLYRPINSDASATPHVVYAQSMFQIMQIGANLIDQYSTDNFPTDIILDGENFYGIKNLPYISAIGDAALRAANPPDISPPTTGSSAITSATTQYQAYVHRWLDFGLWNPHQNAMEAPTSSPTMGPTKIRICAVHGQEFPYIVNLGKFFGANVPSGLTPATDYMGRIFEPPGTTGVSPTTGYVTGAAWIGLNLSDYPNHFAVPTTIDPATAFTSLNDDAADAASLNINSPDGITKTTATPAWQRAGIYMGWSKSPDNPYKVPPCVAVWPNYATLNSASTTAGYAGLLLPTLIPRDASTYFTLPLTIYLQYEDTAHAGVWHTYQELHNFYSTRGASVSGDAYMEPADSGWNNWTNVPPFNPPPSTANTKPVTQLVWGASATFSGPFLTNMDTYVQAFLDPRSVRLNLAALRGSNGTTGANYATGGSGANCMVTTTLAYTGVSLSKGVPTGLHFSDPSNINNTAWAVVKTWIDNVSRPSPIKNYDTAGTSTYYTDRDYIPRVGDAGGWANASPLTTGTQLSAQSPLQLNRPFRSVAELGYVFRDDPWKTLNLISANSADAGLLDLFYIGANTNGPTAPPPDVIAGKMNINSVAANAASTGSSTNSLVLQSLISQTLRDYRSATSATGSSATLNTSITTSSDLQVLTGSVLSYMKTNGPLMNISDVTGIFPQVAAASAPTPLYTGLKNPSEALVRALADSSGTRTWNLMIDVVAQSGKLTSTATSLSNFAVEGEKHYWLHVAIDRFTGEIVAQQLEPVWE